MQPDSGEEDGAIALILELVGDGEGDFGVVRLVVKAPEGAASNAGDVLAILEDDDPGGVGVVTRRKQLLDEAGVEFAKTGPETQVSGLG